MDESTRARLEELRLKKEKLEMIEGLPHLYGHKFYKWSREFFEYEGRYLFLTSANQVGKSSINIRTCIDYCVNPERWQMWDRKPLTFWYLYPTKELASVEIESKWVPEFLPRGKFEKHPQYGWHLDKRQSNISALHFNTGCTVRFLSYMTSQEALQSQTVWTVFFDEELPSELWPELVMRTSSTSALNGPAVRGVFTATLGQNFWYEVMEVKGKGERMPFAKKLQVSLYDCQKFEDGSPSMWTLEAIKEREMACGTEAQRQIRIMGRFAKEEGLKYPTFSREKNVKPPTAVPHDWHWFAGVDPGGGGKSHKAAICFAAIRPDYKYGRIIRCWKGTANEDTTAGDVFTKFQEMRGSRQLMGQFYDWAAKDFQTIATRNGEPFQQADKSHDTGESIINTLFKNEALDIDDTEENVDLINELITLRRDTAKKDANDDCCDSARYCLTKIPWNLEGLVIKSAQLPRKPLNPDEQRLQNARGGHIQEAQFNIEDEIREWNEFYEQY